MATIILNHRVNDFNQWKTMYDSDAPRRDQASLKEICVSSKTDDPNNVYLIWETNEPSVINKMLNDPDLQEKMKEGGVVGKPEVIILT